MKALFLIFHGFSESSGITKKIRSQVKALKECNLNIYTCHYEVLPNKHRVWMINDTVLKDLGSGKVAKIKKRVSCEFISQFVAEEKIEFVYMRSYHNANPFTIKLVKQMRASGAKVVMEIPTYPYDQEYITPAMKLDLCVDKLFRHKLAQTLNAIITFTNHKSIFGQKTIRISNGIDFSSISMKQNRNDTSRELHLIAVAEIHYWHGFDRLIHGLGKYYQDITNNYKVYFHLVGAFSGQREKQEIMSAIHSYSLEPYVILHGAMHGHELDELFEKCDFAIGSLARHRSNITHIKTLKNREYAARGIPFIYSEIDEDFESMPYILKAPADESAVDIVRIIKFAQKEWQPSSIRDSIIDLSWTIQMRKVINKSLK
jgi:glycosyltransferase involved in cell wall biosynthesis